MRLFGSHTMIFGPKKSGKSNFLQWLLSQEVYDGNIVYDVCREHGSLDRYVPEHRRGDEAQAELGGFLERVVVGNDRERRPDVVALEEINRFAGSGGAPPESLYELIDMNRHYGVGIVGVARRPASVHTDLVELADQLVLFRLRGPNDKRKLNQIRSGLGELVEDLGRFEFLVVDSLGEVEHYSPVPEMNTTGRL